MSRENVAYITVSGELLHILGDRKLNSPASDLEQLLKKKRANHYGT